MRLRSWPSLALLALISGVALYFGRAAQPMQNDFWVYFRAAQRMRAGQWDFVYNLEDGAMPFRYFPATLIFFAPLAHLSESVARMVWYCLQTGAFALGAWYLWRSLQKLKVPRALTILAMGGLIGLRYLLDSLLCGQISGLMFLGFSLGLWYWIQRRYVAASLVFVPMTFLKVVPGLFYLMLLLRVGLKRAFRPFLVAGLAALAWTAAVGAWFLPTKLKMVDLISDWVQVVKDDGEYFDASISKTQALRSMLLRWFPDEDYESAERVWQIMAVVSLFALFGFWFRTRKSSEQGDAIAYCLMILAFLILMPQTLPYAMVHLVIPITICLSRVYAEGWSKSRSIVIGALIVFCSIPGTSLVGFHAAEWIQDKSLPLLAMTLLTGHLIWDSQVRRRFSAKTDP